MPLVGTFAKKSEKHYPHPPELISTQDSPNLKWPAASHARLEGCVPYVIQKFGGTSLGKFSLNIVDNVIMSVMEMAPSQNFQLSSSIG